LLINVLTELFSAKALVYWK